MSVTLPEHFEDFAEERHADQDSRDPAPRELMPPDQIQLWIRRNRQMFGTKLPLCLFLGRRSRRNNLRREEKDV